MPIGLPLLWYMTRGRLLGFARLSSMTEQAGNSSNANFGQLRQELTQLSQAWNLATAGAEVGTVRALIVSSFARPARSPCDVWPMGVICTKGFLATWP